jgi:hypothetical protein
MTGLEVLISAPIAVGVGYAVGRIPRWKTWTGYVALIIVAPIAVVAGVPIGEAVVDCVGLGAGFALARR